MIREGDPRAGVKKKVLQGAPRAVRGPQNLPALTACRGPFQRIRRF